LPDSFQDETPKRYAPHRNGTEGERQGPKNYGKKSEDIQELSHKDQVT
jgi:hypothetical protein